MREIGRVGKGSGALDLRKSTVFVDNLPNGIRKGFLYNLYSRFGKIRDCYIPDKKSKRTGQSFGFIRFESISDAAQAVEVTNRYWIWGRELFVNVAKFLKKQGASPTQIYNQYKQKNLEGEDGSRNQRDYNNQHSNFNSQANNGNAIGNGKEVVIYQQNDRIQRSAQKLKGLEKRGEGGWRRKVVPEYSNQGGVGRSRFQEGEVKDGRKTIKVQAVGNGWLSRSAVGKVRRLISAQDLVSLFKKEKLGSIQIKPMGGRYMVITFPSEARRNEVLKEKWLDLWFEEVKPWNGEAAKDERFVWIACYGMPLDAWNIPSFRAIGSSWGCFIEVDSDTLREISFTKGRILIATENPNKIEGEVQLVVNGREYNVRVEEEDTFRTVPSTDLVSNSEVNSEEEEEDDEVGRVDDEVDASKTMKQNSVDDMENQGNESLDDRAKINEEEVEKGETNDINGSHKDELEKEPAHEESYAQRKSGGGKHIENFASCENINEESHTSHGLVSIVQDSQSPIAEECVESVQKNFQVLNAEPKLGDNQDQEKGVKEANNSGAYESDVSLRASQLPEINLHIDLNPSAARKNIRSQQLETSLSTDGDDIDEYIMGFQEQEHDAIEKEMQNTLAAGNTLGIKFDKSGILRMKKMIENESIAMKASIKNNSFAPLLRDY